MERIPHKYQKYLEPTEARRSDFFGEVSTVKLYLKDAHFELQQHDLIGPANREFEAEINGLPPELSSIHDDLSTSQTNHQTNQALGHLVVYVRKTFTQHHLSVPYENYMLTAAKYAELGRVHHNDTTSGNHTFAVILLTILFEGGDSRAQTCLDQMTGLRDKNTPSTVIILNNLSKAIIEAKDNLEAPAVVTILTQAEELLCHDQKLTAAAGRVLGDIKTLTQSPLLEEVARTTESVRDGNFEASTLERYRQLADEVRHQPDFGHRIAGLMFAVLGLALIMASALIFSGSLGLAAAPALPAMGVGIAALAAGGGSLYAGVHFFRSGIGKAPEPVKAPSRLMDEGSLAFSS
jgi:hypothetical protein